MGMGLALVLGDEVLGDVPAAVATGRGFFVAGVAVERAAVEELLQAAAVLRGQFAGLARQRQFVAAAVAVALGVLAEERGEVVVDGPVDGAGPVAQWAGDAHLGGDGLADEGALV